MDRHVSSCAARLALVGLAACGSSEHPGRHAIPRSVPVAAAPRVAVLPSASASAIAPDPPRPGALVNRTVIADGDDLAALAIDAQGNRFIAGRGDLRKTGLAPSTTRPAFVAKLDPNNAVVWQTDWGGGPRFRAGSIAVDADGGVFVAGTFANPTLLLGTGPLTNAATDNSRTSDLFLVKMASDGVVRWAKRYGDAYDQREFRVHAYPGGGVIGTGCVIGAVDFGSGPLRGFWDTAFFVTRIDSDGRPRFGKSFGRCYTSTTDSDVDANGDVFVSSGSDGTPEFVRGGFPSPNDVGPAFVHLDGAGKTLAARRFGSGATDITTAVALDRKGGLRIATSTRGTTSFDGDPRAPRAGMWSLVAASFDASGTLAWKREVLVGLEIVVSAAVTDDDGNFYFVGQYVAKDVSRRSTREGYVVKLTSTGDIDWTLKLDDAVVADIAIGPDARPMVVGATIPSREVWIGALVP